MSKKTIKMFDLLVKAYTGEEMPRKIKYDYHNFIYDESYNDYYQSMSGGNKLFISFNDLNDNVEIIEDAPKDPIMTLKGTPNSIRKDLGLSKLEDKKIYNVDITALSYDQIIIAFTNKINEIIDFINRKND